MKVLADDAVPLPGVTRVASAGAPVPPDVVAKMRRLLPANAQLPSSGPHMVPPNACRCR